MDKFVRINELKSRNLNSREIDLFKYFIPIAVYFLIFVSAVFSLYFIYQEEKKQKNDYLAKVKLDIEAVSIQDILSILVPRFVIERINQGSVAMQEAQEDVVILFCDICEFDKIINEEGKRIVHILDELFRHFDSLCAVHGVQKIETVGKTYMGAAGIPSCEVGIKTQILQTEKTRRVLNMAFDMMSHIEKLTYGKGEKFKAKIGIHIGRVIAGVIGHHKPQFSLIGDTVNTTSRVCSTGDDCQITISEQSYINVKDSQLFFKKKVVQAKGKGDLITFQVQKISKKIRNNFLKKRILKVLPQLREYKKNLEQFQQKNQENVEKPKKQNKALNLLLNIAMRQKLEKEENNEEVEKIHSQFLLDSQRNIKESYLQDANNEEEIKKEIAEEKKKNKQNVLHTENCLLLFPKSQIVQETKFRSDLLDSGLKESRYLIIILGFIQAILAILTTIIRVMLKNSIIVLGLKFTLCFLLIFSYFIPTYIIKKQLIRLFYCVLYHICVIVVIVHTYLFDFWDLHIIQMVDLFLIHSIFLNFSFFNFSEILIMSLNTTLMYAVVLLVLKKIQVEYAFYFAIIMLINILKSRIKFRFSIKSFNNLHKNEAKKNELNSLVSQLLPYHAFQKLKYTNITNKLQLTDEMDQVSLLFADIAGFTKYSSSVTPEDVVNMLRNLFTEFDKMCLKHNVYKVYTIGDCYVIMGFTNANKRDPIKEAKNTVKMGYDMIKIIADVRKIIKFDDLDMRIGIHTGHLIGGIIGTDIVRYDIYGKDVLIANKMESNGLEGHVMVSESTKNLLQKDKNLEFEFEKIKEVPLKTEPYIMNGYLIKQKDFREIK